MKSHCEMVSTKTNKSKSEEAADILAYKKHRNIEVRLNNETERKPQHTYFFI